MYLTLAFIHIIIILKYVWVLVSKKRWRIYWHVGSSRSNFIKYNIFWLKKRFYIWINKYMLRSLKIVENGNDKLYANVFIRQKESWQTPQSLSLIFLIMITILIIWSEVYEYYQIKGHLNEV